MSYGTMETLTEPRTVDGNDLAKMLLDILTGYVGSMPPPLQAIVAQHRDYAEKILKLAKAHDDTGPLLGMLIAGLTVLAEDETHAAPPGVTH